MIVYAAIENGIELSDSEGVKIGEYEESTIILDTIFDEGFESVIFEIEPSSESEIITVMLYNGMFDYPADLDEYYVLADAEPANVKHMHGEDATEIEIKVEPDVQSALFLIFKNHKTQIVHGHIDDPSFINIIDYLLEEMILD